MKLIPRYQNPAGAIQQDNTYITPIDPELSYIRRVEQDKRDYDEYVSNYLKRNEIIRPYEWSVKYNPYIGEYGPIGSGTRISSYGLEPVPELDFAMVGVGQAALTTGNKIYNIGKYFINKRNSYNRLKHFKTRSNHAFDLAKGSMFTKNDFLKNPHLQNLPIIQTLVHSVGPEDFVQDKEINK